MQLKAKTIFVDIEYFFSEEMSDYHYYYYIAMQNCGAHGIRQEHALNFLLDSEQIRIRHKKNLSLTLKGLMISLRA